MDINDLEKAYMDEKQYAEASFKTVLALQKQIEKLKEENESLLKMVEGKVPLVTNDFASLGIDNKVLIAETQLHFLKNTSMERELTKDEAQKFAIYVDVLTKLKPKANETPGADKLSDEELINVIQLNGSSNKK